MHLFYIKVQIDPETKNPKIRWMKPDVKYPVYDTFKRTEKLDIPPGFKIITWVMIADPSNTQLAWVNLNALDYAGED